VAQIARSVMARVLVGEVYLESVFEQKTCSAFIWAKFHHQQQPDQGLRIERSALRLGLGSTGYRPENVALERSVRRHPAHPAERLSAVASQSGPHQGALA